MFMLTDKHKILFQIDEEDFESVSRYSWCISNYGYVMTKGGKWPNLRTILLHKFLLWRAPHEKQWDHINRNKLDNRRSNLRPVSRVVNMRNKGVKRTNKTGVCGVSRRDNGRYLVRINTGKTQKRVGLYLTLEAATAARLAAESLYWGSER